MPSQRQRYKFKGIGRLLDDALPGLIDEFSKIPFNHGALKVKDILGHIYEYFLGEFSIAAGKRGCEFYTPKSIVSLIVEMLEPFEGRVYDPCCGSGGFFVQSERFVLEYGGKIGHLSIYGQEFNPTTLGDQFKESARLEAEIRKNLAGLGYAI